MATKAELVSTLRARGVAISDSKAKKTPLATLEQMVAESPIDIDAGSPDADVKPRATRTRAAANTGGDNVVRLPRASKGINLSPRPADQIKSCRENSKQAAIIDCLVTGATLWELVGACSGNAGGGKDWSESSVRSALHWDVNKVKGYGVRTVMMTPRQAYDDGHEAHCENMLGTEQEHEPIIPVYFLVLPKGLDAPLPHTTASETRMAANTAPKPKE